MVINDLNINGASDVDLRDTLRHLRDRLDNIIKHNRYYVTTSLRGRRPQDGTLVSNMELYEALIDKFSSIILEKLKN
jgi:hypothetical protein